MATVDTMVVDVPEYIAEALAPLGAPLSVDEHMVKEMLSDLVREAGAEAETIGDCSEMDPAALRRIAARLAGVAAALEAFCPKNLIHESRRLSGWSRARYAEHFGVDVEKVAAWEAGTAIPTRDLAYAMAGQFGFARDYFLGVACDVCARCGKEPPLGNPQRFDAGWDVAAGTELVCPECLTPADLEW